MFLRLKDILKPAGDTSQEPLPSGLFSGSVSEPRTMLWPSRYNAMGGRPPFNR